MAGRNEIVIAASGEAAQVAAPGSAAAALAKHEQEKMSRRANLYNNLYWTCAECNQNKGDTWPSPSEEARGERFLDPCRAEDDGDGHITVVENGTVTAITSSARGRTRMFSKT